MEKENDIDVVFTGDAREAELKVMKWAVCWPITNIRDEEEYSVVKLKRQLSSAGEVEGWKIQVGEHVCHQWCSTKARAEYLLSLAKKSVSNFRANYVESAGDVIARNVWDLYTKYVEEAAQRDAENNLKIKQLEEQAILRFQINIALNSELYARRRECNDLYKRNMELIDKERELEEKTRLQHDASTILQVELEVLRNTLKAITDKREAPIVVYGQYKKDEGYVDELERRVSELEYSNSQLFAAVGDKARAISSQVTGLQRASEHTTNLSQACDKISQQEELISTLTRREKGYKNALGNAEQSIIRLESNLANTLAILRGRQKQSLCSQAQKEFDHAMFEVQTLCIQGLE